MAGRPLIEWQIEWLKSYGVREFIVCAGYLATKTIEALKNGRRLGVKIAYVVEPEPLGTAGALKNAELILRNEPGFFVLNGDILAGLNPLRLIEAVERDENLVGAIAVVPMPSPYGVIHFDDNMLITKFEEKPRLPFWINAGVYYFRPSIFDYLPEQGDLEKEVFPKLAERRLLKAVCFDRVPWKSLDTHKDLKEMEHIVAQLFGGRAQR